MAASVLTVLAGCSFYHPLPLDQTAVDKALEPQRTDALVIAAAKIDHPLLPALTIDGRDGFTPDEISVIAVIASPQLRALRDQRGVLQAQVIQAGLLPNPQLGWSYDRQTGNSDPTLVNGHSLGIGWELTSLIGYRDRVASAKSAAKALDLDIAWQEWQTAQAARIASFKILSLETKLPIAREAETEAGEAYALSRRAHDEGHMTGPDLAAAAEARSTAQETRRAVEQDLVSQRLALNLMLGKPADSVVKLKPSEGTLDVAVTPQSVTALLDGLEKRRLDLLALTLGYESADESLRAAVKAQFPRISMNFAKARDTSDVRMRSYAVSVDLPLFDRNQGQVAAASATRQQLFDEYVSRVAEARSEVRQALAGITGAREKLSTLKAETTELEQTVTRLDQAWKNRNVDFQVWRDARALLAAKRLEMADSRQALFELGVALELATGRRLVGSTPNS